VKPSEILRKARGLITPEGAWTKGESARDANGNAVTRPHTDVSCRCVDAALYDASGVTPGPGSGATAEYALYQEAYGFFRSVVGGCHVTWNDDPARTHAEVLAAFDRAAEMAEGEGS